jgi:hypothetical protein
MDKHLHIKGHYIVMDNVPIHTHVNMKSLLDIVDVDVCIFLLTLPSLTR